MRAKQVPRKSTSSDFLIAPISAAYRRFQSKMRIEIPIRFNTNRPEKSRQDFRPCSNLRLAHVFRSSELQSLCGNASSQDRVAPPFRVASLVSTTRPDAATRGNKQIPVATQTLQLRHSHWLSMWALAPETPSQKAPRHHATASRGISPRRAFGLLAALLLGFFFAPPAGAALPAGDGVVSVQCSDESGVSMGQVKLELIRSPARWSNRSLPIPADEPISGM